MGARVLLLLLALVAATRVVAQEAPPELRFHVAAFEVQGESPIPDAAAQEILAGFVGDHVGLDGLAAAADALEQAIRGQGHVFHRVLLPAQRLSGGVVRLQVVAFSVGTVAVEGNEHFGEDNIRASIPSLRGDTSPNTAQLSRELALANSHSAKDVALSFRQSRTREAIDATLRVQDRKPWMVFGSLSNTGSEQTGDFRLSVGGQYSNLFDLDQAVTVSFTTSPGHWEDVRQYGINYRAPVYALAGAVDAYYVSSDVDSGTVANFFDVSGSGEFFGARYTQMLARRGAYSHEVSAGIDNRDFDNEVLFGQFNLGSRVRSTPLALRYAGSYGARDWQGSFSVEYARNLGLGGQQSATDYAAASGRPGADVQWDALRAEASGVHSLPRGWALHGLVAVQVANEPLIPGEQFGAGGAGSVRGMEEREISGDNGLRATAEVWSPPLPHGVRLLGFVDAARVHLENAQPGQSETQNVASAGLGLRWQWKDTAGLQIDVGRMLNGAASSGRGSYKAHVNLFARF